ncbi:MAG: hypothetical protein ACOYL6_14220 [Bacteriovoracaceae bacterium]
MKTKLLILPILLFSTYVLAEKLTPEQRVEQLKKKKDLSLEDFEHENPGCPENSDCTMDMGKHRKNWLELIKKLEKEKAKENELVTKIEEFRKTNGIPVEFYSNGQAFARFAPIVFESPCPSHNPKKKEDKILIGETFVKNTVDTTAHIKVMSTTHDIPFGDLVYFDPIYVYHPKHPEKNLIFYVPKGEKPLYLNGNELTILRDENTLFYGLNINTSGEWHVAPVKSRHELGRDEYHSDVPCVKNEEAEKYFGKDFYKRYYNDNYCQTIYDLKSKTEWQMRLPWSC